MKFLIVVDMQNDFAHPQGKLYVKGGEVLGPKINKLIDSGHYDRIIFTQDWHPANHSSFKTWPEHCVEGTWGSAFVDYDEVNDPDNAIFATVYPINTKFDLLIRKGQNPEADSYSGFYDENMVSTGLVGYIQEAAGNHEVEVTIVGLATDYCIKHTALHCVRHFPRTTVIRDHCCAVNVNPKDEFHAIVEMEQAGVSIRGDNKCK